MLTKDELNTLVLLLQTHTPLSRLSYMEAETVLQFMQQRGYTLNKPAVAR
ncbi:hypothetical protein [Bradyrhizobium sp. AUGA SZCCT0431]|nr:hypothetical protein [Bradyrhizobium sp. AUGA SZCCT0431]MBR1145085.1 hypothetical protein [Bradyrhizobium sp. AUGA SZCCT0431]